jgi:DNA polymerase lambda
LSEAAAVASALEQPHAGDTSHKLTKMLDQGDSGSDFVNSGDEKESDVKESSNITSKCSPEKTKGTWICAAPSTSKGSNYNQHITDKLQVLATSYANTKDQWRALGYKKAIASIKAYHKRIETWEECSKIAFVGGKLAKKIWEIVETGHLRRLDHLDPKIEAINLFTDVWGAGPTTAELWVSKGLRTLEDLKKHGSLNRQQQVGLMYFEEFRERMPREEAGKIGEQVHTAAKEIDSGLVCETCGSYRRGKPTCGDVDVLVSHPDGRSHQGALQKILEHLKSKGFITDDLVSVHNSEQNKYMGVCKLPEGESKHRRLDIIVVPHNEWACAILYFTGSDYFNRSARLLARKNGMSLSEKSLNTGVIRHGGEKVFEGTPLPVFSEKDIFKYLGLEYREPVERDW